MAEFDPSILVSEYSKRVADMNWFSTEVGGEGEEKKVRRGEGEGRCEVPSVL